MGFTSSMSGKREYDKPDSPGSVGWTHVSKATVATPQKPFVLHHGHRLDHVEVEYETFGKLNGSKDNAILIMHALSGDAHVAGWDADAAAMGRKWRLGKPGWWDEFIGPGKPIDTERYFIICANVLGGCYGTTGPVSVNPATNRKFGLQFPTVSINDWVKIHGLLLDHLGIDELLAAIGGSLGGQQSLEFSLSMPDRLRGVVILAASPKLSVQGLAFNAVARHAITTDPFWNSGNYSSDNGPEKGLSVARMIAHITYISEVNMEHKFGRKVRTNPSVTPHMEGGQQTMFDTIHANQLFEVESYLKYQGNQFVERFDANSYLYIIRAMDFYDAAAWGDGDLVEAARRVHCESLIISFSSDWLYPPEHCRNWATALSRIGRSVSYVNIPSVYGHDAFLIDLEKQGRLVASFLERLQKKGRSL